MRACALSVNGGTVVLSRIPAPEPSVFSGDPLKFLEWRTSFKALIERRCTNPADNLFYLQKYVSGEAQSVLEGSFYRKDDEAYDQAWEALNSRYGHPFVIQRAFREKLNNWPKIGSRESAKLRQFSDFLTACSNAMPHIKGLQVLNDCEENQKMLQKLPDWLTSRWNRHVTMQLRQLEEYPTFKEFADFVAQEAEIACNPHQKYQEMCQRGIEWDDPLPTELMPQWSSWLNELKSLHKLQITRCFAPEHLGTVQRIELHHFSDASSHGYGQCSYIRVLSKDKVHCSFVIGKARVAPTKIVTIPRLELTAAVISSAVSTMLKEELELKIDQEYFWTDSKHPAVLPRDSVVTRLIVDYCYEKTQHQGRGQTLNELRANGYWVVGGSKVVANHIKQCVTCRRARRPTETQMMADLPANRLDPSPPFSYCGMDCFGPFLCKQGRKEHKRYGLIFTCFSSRAIHIEMLEDLTTDAFINALRCFIAIRGAVREIRSDQGTNFVGAKNELTKALEELDKERLAVKEIVNFGARNPRLMVKDTAHQDHHMRKLCWVVLPHPRQEPDQTSCPPQNFNQRTRLHPPANAQDITSNGHGLPTNQQPWGTPLCNDVIKGNPLTQRQRKSSTAAYLSQKQCDFTLNVPDASHMGGVWERQIRTFRSVLSWALSQSAGRLDDASLRTFFYEAMSVINTRPLTTDTINDPKGLEPLTPNHLLTMKSSVPLPPPVKFEQEDLYVRKRWRRVQYLTQQFWSRWRKEYLANIALRQRWHSPRRNVKIGDVVIVKEEELPPQ
ncbi:Gypsy retrotransposon integrase-like protein 1 [Labeo rohita]|uniref:Gypsy retrotransposon integrase-like protein 1 n=1 Tax=Labeo rohita TaxID=84645 RepID=A0ABQ8LBX6_LABRO|nr:Gypsy retrotransposon integrase-like protein 1 [Labeo rohita]